MGGATDPGIVVVEDDQAMDWQLWSARLSHHGFQTPAARATTESEEFGEGARGPTRSLVFGRLFPYN